MLEIVSFIVECFQKGETVPKEYYFNYLCNKDNDQCWYPAWDETVVIKISQDQVKFERNITHIHVRHISGAKRVIDIGLYYRLAMSNAAKVFGKSLEMIARKEWSKFSFDPEYEPWEGNAIIGVFEIDDVYTDTEPPKFRGFLPMDERLLAIEIPEDCWEG